MTVKVKLPKYPRHASAKLLDFLASWEGERLTAYKVPGESFYTIGIGHTGYVNNRPIHKDMKISREKSRELLRHDLAAAEAAVLKLVPRRWRRRQHRFDCFVSLAFNFGSEILTASPPLTSFGEVLKKPCNHKTIDDAVAALKLYNKGGSPLRVMAGLVKRRAAEGQMLKYGRYLHNI
jgi:lysozyme